MAVNRSKRSVPLIDDYHLLTYEEVDSTNEEAKRLALGGGAHGAFLWSLRQTNGKGRKGREWISHDGNLFVSVLLQPGCNFDRMPQLSYVAAMAAHQTIHPLLSEEDQPKLRFKWPNDLLFDEQKLAGILLESIETTDELDGSRQRWAIVGLGMNIESCPDQLEYPATYLKELGLELVSAKIILSRFIHHFIHCYSQWQKEGFRPVREAWMQHCLHHDQFMSVKVGDQQIHGQFDRLDSRGNLVLKDKNGEEQAIAAGEVILS